MLNVAICEDNLTDMKKAEELLRQELPLFFQNFQVTKYTTGSSLIDALKNNNFQPGLIFLDIFLKDMSGIELAHLIRDRGYPIHIVFITLSREYVMESYHINADYYILKPVTKDWIHRALERVAHVMKMSECYLILKKNNSTLKIPQTRIHYIETLGNKTYIHTENAVTSVFKPLKQIAEMLDPHMFLLIQRGIIVNMNYIVTIRNNICTLENRQSYHLSRKNCKALREKYFDFLFHKTF